MDTATLEVYKKPLSEIKKLNPYLIKPKTMANRLRKRATVMKRCQVKFPKKQLDQVITLLQKQQ